MALELWMFAAAAVLLLSGYPVAFTLAGVGLAFALIGSLTGQFDEALLRALPTRIYALMSNQTLLAVPLFIFMGVVLERSRVAEELLTALGQLLRKSPGGLGLAVVLVGGLLAASTGIVGATVVTLTLLAMPSMLDQGWRPSLSAGTIAASGTLGQIIPPSIALILLGDVMANAYQSAQRAQGIFSPDVMSIGDVFAGALIPGVMLVGLYCVYVMVTARHAPAAWRQSAKSEDDLPGFGALAQAFAPPLLLIVAVLGSILTGVATPTEAAAVGAGGALLLAGLRSGNGARGLWRILMLTGLAGTGLAAIMAFAFDLRLEMRLPSIGAGIALSLAALGLAAALLRLTLNATLGEAAGEGAKITAMVFAILIGAAVFSLVFRGLGGDETVSELLNAAPGGTFGALIIVMIVMFLLGFFLDFIEITFIVVPVVAPALLAMGIDPVWLAVLMALNLQTSFLTPPFGFALFYLRGAAPASVQTAQIYRGVIPFVVLQLLALALVAAFPQLATWLPDIAG